MNDSPWFPMYPADFLAATQSWENDTVGVYVRLLFHQWVTGRIPTDDKRALCRAAGIFPDELGKYQWLVDSKFPRGKNQRLEEERKKRNERRKNGSKGGRPPKDPPVEKPKSKPNENQTDNQSETKQETESKAKPKGSQSQSHIQSHIQSQPPSQPEKEGASPPSSLESGVEKFLNACGVEYVSGAIGSEVMRDAYDRSVLFLNVSNLDKLCRHAAAWRAKRKSDEKTKGLSFRPVSAPVAFNAIDDILATDPDQASTGRRKETTFTP